MMKNKFSKSWITNPRGSEDSYKKKKLSKGQVNETKFDYNKKGLTSAINYANKLMREKKPVNFKWHDKEYEKSLTKEGGADGGGFGDGGGTVAVSTDSGFFTPTYGGKKERRKAKKKKEHDKYAKLVLGDLQVEVPPKKTAVKKVDDEIPLRKGQKEKLKKGYKWFTIGIGDIVKGEFVKKRTVRTQGKEIKLKGSPKNLNWFVNKGTDGLWVVTNVETGRTLAVPAFGNTMKAAIGFAERELSKPENIERLKELVLSEKPEVVKPTKFTKKTTKYFAGSYSDQSKKMRKLFATG